MTVTHVAAAQGTSPVVPGNAGHPLDEAPLPYWLSEPCPPWCGSIIPHEEGVMPADRAHTGDSYEIELTQVPADVCADGDGTILSSDPYVLIAALGQHYRECEPHVSVNIDAGRDIDLTLAEAVRMAKALNGPGDESSMISATLEDSDRCAPPGTWPWSAARPRQIEIRLESAEETEAAADLGAPERRVVIVYRDCYLVLTPAEAAELAAAIVKLLDGAR
jgi:hypothetical protein